MIQLLYLKNRRMNTMADIDYSALENAVVTLESEDGESMECQLACVFEYNDQDYAAFTEIDNEENEVYLFTLTAVPKKKETEFEFNMVEDEDLLDELIEVLQQIMDAELEDEDGPVIDEDEDDDDEDEDDSRWDEFITKKLD